MKNETKSNASIYWVIGVIVVSMCVFVYLFISDAPKTLPKIKLSYFVDENEIADSVAKRLYQEMKGNSNYWIGVEPEKNEQLEVVLKLKSSIEKNAILQKVIVDKELSLSEDFLKSIGATDVLPLKENLWSVGEKIAEYEKQNVSYLLVTASIYTNSLLKQNPIHKIKEKYSIKPMTFSLAYFPTTPEEEKNMLFQCDTENNNGVKDWACLVVSKARFTRRKIDHTNTKAWVGLMDLSSENDYVVLLKKKNVE